MPAKQDTSSLATEVLALSDAAKARHQYTLSRGLQAIAEDPASLQAFAKLLLTAGKVEA